MQRFRQWIRRFYNPGSVRTSILLSFMAIIILVVFLLSLLSYRHTMQDSRRTAISYTDRLLSEITYSIDAYIDNMKSTADLVGRNSDVRSLLSLYQTRAETGEANETEIRRLRERVAALMETAASTRSDITNIAVVSRSGEVVLSDRTKQVKPYADFMATDWYLRPLSYTKDIIVSPSHVQNLVQGEYPWVISISKAITDPLTEAVTGVLVVDLNYSAIAGICENAQIKCYGSNLATGEPVTVGEAVGIIAAQSIGEPGTQLTMRTFHTGGIASSQDITQGLPRVEELFEARKPKTLAILSEIDGRISFREIKKNEHIVVTNDETAEEKSYLIPYGFRKRFNSETDADGNPVYVTKGTALTEGSPNPHDILAISGVHAVHDYLIKEVQRTYRMQGVDINDKHIEVIVRQMMRKLKVDEPGSTSLLPGATVEKFDFQRANAEAKQKAEEEGTEFVAATCEPVLLGITKASLATDSFLSAASFQETTRVLTDAAIKGKTDPLIGLKENVIIGKLLPSGTGMKCYSEVEIEPVAQETTAAEDVTA